MATRMNKIATFEMPSQSVAGKVYETSLYENGTWWCSCPAYKFQKRPVSERTCKHQRLAQRVVTNLVAQAQSIGAIRVLMSGSNVVKVEKE